jgi:hypothetical protein
MCTLLGAIGGCLTSLLGFLDLAALVALVTGKSEAEAHYNEAIPNYNVTLMPFVFAENSTLKVRGQTGIVEGQSTISQGQSQDQKSVIDSGIAQCLVQAVFLIVSEVLLGICTLLTGTEGSDTNDNNEVKDKERHIKIESSFVAEAQEEDIYARVHKPKFDEYENNLENPGPVFNTDYGSTGRQKPAPHSNGAAASVERYVWSTDEESRSKSEEEFRFGRKTRKGKTESEAIWKNELIKSEKRRRKKGKRRNVKNDSTGGKRREKKRAEEDFYTASYETGSEKARLVRKDSAEKLTTSHRRQQLKKRVLVCSMMFFGLCTNYAYFVYVTNYVGQVIYEGDPNADAASDAYAQYVEGVHIASLGMLTFYCLFVVFNLLHNKILQKIGQCRL